MKIAVVGGTHGNEFTGVEVCKALEKSQQSYKNEYRTFIANPMAHLKKLRYVDSDLNRAYSKTSSPLGNEKERSDFDFSSQRCNRALAKLSPIVKRLISRSAA